MRLMICAFRRAGGLFPQPSAIGHFRMGEHLLNSDNDLSVWNAFLNLNIKVLGALSSACIFQKMFHLLHLLQMAIFAKHSAFASNRLHLAKIQIDNNIHEIAR